MNVLVTGGGGYIGSHTCVSLLENDYGVVVIDNLSNSKAEAINRVREITGRKLTFYHADVCDAIAVSHVFEKESIDCVIHFAGLKSVAESVAQPLAYYRNNILSTLVLCDVMHRHGVRNLVFSSSATVYGNPAVVPLKEDAPVAPVNPYGRTKWMVEQILSDLYRADNTWRIALLRYFNPIGAHESGRIGEDPSDIPNNLMPYISKVAVNALPELYVYGNDYPTPDGTGIRDYIHVMDLADGHIKALEKLVADGGIATYNLGTGRGYSVLEVVAAFEAASGIKIPYRIVGRRPGDIPVLYADPKFARQELGWATRRDIDAMCADAWRWQKNNPRGYESA